MIHITLTAKGSVKLKKLHSLNRRGNWKYCYTYEYHYNYLVRAGFSFDLSDHLENPEIWTYHLPGDEGMRYVLSHVREYTFGYVEGWTHHLGDKITPLLLSVFCITPT